MVGRGYDVSARDAPISPGEEEFAWHTAQCGLERNNDAAVGDATTDIAQSLMLPLHPEKWMSIFNPSGGARGQGYGHMCHHRGGRRNCRCRPTLYDSPPFIWMFQTTRMKSALGYGRQGRIARLVGSSGATNIWEILLSSLEYLFSGGADNLGASYRP